MRSASLRNRLVISSIYLFSFVVILLPSNASGSPPGDRSSVLSAGEGFFVSLRDGDTRSSWRLLTRTSREEIAESVRRGMRARGREVDLQAILDDFDSNGPMSKAFWSAFMSRFKPETALEESVWEIEELDDLKAILRITHRASQRPALLRLFREGGEWKIGFTETFVRPGGP